MSDQGAYALLKTIRGQREQESNRTMTRKQENDRWLSVQTSAIPIHTTQIDNPPPPQEPVQQQFQPRPHNYGFYREIVAKHDHVMRQMRRP